jgi:nitrate reductase gamma subunit
MSLIGFTQIIAALALAFTLAAFGLRLRSFSQLARPKDRSTPKGNAQAGIFYAYTLGMAPWAKESTRRHWVAYLRGIFFHIGIFLGLGIFLVSPWMAALPGSIRALLAFATGVGALLGLAGFILRFVERNLKALSTPDDYFAALMVSVFLAAASAWLAGWVSLPVFYLVSGLMLVYAPFSKIRHCIYFAYSRLFFGRFVGARAVLPHGQQQEVR